MFASEILQHFDTPTQRSVKALKEQNAQLERLIKLNNSAIAKLSAQLSAEEDKIANKLDKKFPDWRKVIVRELRDSRK